MIGHQEELEKLKRELETAQSAEQVALETSTDHVVEDAVDRVEDEQTVDDIVDDALADNGDDVEDDVEEPQEDVAEDDYEEDADIEDEKDTKKLRKRIEGNYRKKMKERDEEIKELRNTLQQIQQQQAEQKGYIEGAKLKEQTKVVNQDPEPDPTLDPEDHMAWQIRQMQKENEELRANQQTQQQAIDEQVARNAVNTLEANYKASNPDVDYDAAKNFVKNRERTMIKLQYPTITDAQVDAYLDKYEMDMFTQMAKSGQDATSVIVNMAKENGYEPDKKTPKKKRPNLQAIKKNAEKNASLIGGTDTVKERSITPDQILNMSMDDLVRGGSELFTKAHKSI